MERQTEVEILIHIGAPSRAADDARYRALAAAYQEFEPVEHAHLPPQLRSSIGIEEDQHTPAPQGSQPGLDQDDVSTDVPSSGRLGSLKSPQASFRSVIDNAGSPRLRARQVLLSSPVGPGDTTIPATQSSWQTPPSVVEDSYPMNHMHITSLSSPTRVLEHYLHQFESPSGSSKTNTSPSGSAKTNTQHSGRGATHKSSSLSASQPSLPRRLFTSVVPCTPSVIPCSPRHNPPSDSSSFLGRDSSGHRDRSVQIQRQGPTSDEVTSDNIIEETTIMSSSQASADTRADSEPPPKRHQPDLPSTSPRALMRASSDIGPRTTSEQKSLITVAFLDVHGFTYESLELRAPKPPTSVLHLEPPDLVTPSLQKLARALEIPKRFRPKEQKRDLRPFERGHWLLDCSSWEPQLRRDAWAYLANYIGTGVAGWGIWCKRDPEFQWLRTYCFGGVAAHIYLLLYLASQRTILYTGSTWVDGDRIEVITMGARDKQ